VIGEGGGEGEGEERRLTRLGVALTKEVMKRRLSVVRRKTSNDSKNELYKNIRLLGCHRVMIPPHAIRVLRHCNDSTRDYGVIG